MCRLLDKECVSEKETVGKWKRVSEPLSLCLLPPLWRSRLCWRRLQHPQVQSREKTQQLRGASRQISASAALVSPTETASAPNSFSRFQLFKTAENHCTLE